MNPIIFVHGIGGDRKQYKPIMDYLRKNNINNFYEFNYVNKFGFCHIKDLAEELAEFIKDNVKEKAVNIIGFSQGGIIALAYLRFYKNAEVEKLFTVCTPHRGSKLAKIMSLPGFVDLRPGSDLLKELEKFTINCETEIYALYTPLDIMVFPGWNARQKHGKNKIIFAPEHNVAFSWLTTKKFILKNLLKENKYERIANFIRGL